MLAELKRGGIMGRIVAGEIQSGRLGVDFDFKLKTAKGAWDPDGDVNRVWLNTQLEESL